MIVRPFSHLSDCALDFRDIQQQPEYLPPDVLHPELYKMLLRVREALELELPGFPTNACWYASTVVARATNLHIVAGEYVFPDGRRNSHFWNSTRDHQFFVDLTQDQFHPGAPRVVILDAQSSALQETPSTQDYTSISPAEKTLVDRVEKRLALMTQSS